jgi:hypothetical protein
MNSLAKILLALYCTTFVATTAVAQIVLPGGTPPTPTPSPQSSAPAGLITKVTAQQVAQLISGAVSGTTITPQIKAGSNGTSIVTFPVWGDQVYSAVSVENCAQDNSGCYTLEFFANFGKQPSITQAWINGWNSQYYVVRAYPLSTGEIVFTADLMVLNGVTSDYITGFAGFFKKVVDNASTYKPSSN